MTIDSYLEKIAKTRNWIAFGKELSAALNDPHMFGFDDKNRLLRHVAQLRGVDPESLRNPLAAVYWMKQNAPKALEDENSKIPMTGVRTLSQISMVSEGLAEELAPRFFSGELNRRQLEIALRRAEAEHGRNIVRHVRMKQTVEFEEQVFSFFQSYPGSLDLGPDIKIVKTGRNALVPSDFTVVRGGRTIGVVECKAQRTRRHRRYLIETLALAALHTGDDIISILVVPDTWGSSVAELSQLSQDLKLDDVRIGIFRADVEQCGSTKFGFDYENR